MIVSKFGVNRSMHVDARASLQKVDRKKERKKEERKKEEIDRYKTQTFFKSLGKEERRKKEERKTSVHRTHTQTFFFLNKMHMTGSDTCVGWIRFE